MKQKYRSEQPELSRNGIPNYTEMTNIRYSKVLYIGICATRLITLSGL